MILFGLLCLGCENTRQEDTADIDETASDTPRPIVSDEERQTDFNRRTEVSPPPSLPKVWVKMLRACRGKLEAVSFRRGSHQTVWRGRTDLSLTFRMFGTDTEVNATLVKALAPLNLYQFNGRAEDQTHGSSTRNWSLELNRLVAPKGAARQTQVVLTWSRFPSPVQERGKCRKPKSMEADSTLPMAQNP